jgi:iron complex outermembrane recepter protein
MGEDKMGKKNPDYALINRVALGAALVPLALASGTALAQQAAPPAQADNTGGIHEIIVTAQRHAESANKVPLSLTALDKQSLQDHQVADMSDLQMAAPGIRAGQQQGVTRIFIRGIGLNSFAAGADPSVAFYSDGVYIGRPTAQASGFYDIDRIEVLRGPQGALYGRNATGGAVNVISEAPQRELGGDIKLTGGNYDLFEAEGAINAPLTRDGDLRMRISTDILSRGGYGYDVTAHHPVNDAKTQSLRGQLQYENGNGVNVRFIGEYHHELDNDDYTMSFGAYPGYQLQGETGVTAPGGTLYKGIAVNNSQNAATDLDGYTNRRLGLAFTLNASVDVSDHLSLNSITSYRKWDRFNASNSDDTSAGIGNTYYTERSQQFSQELVANYKAGILTVVGGLSYYFENLKNHVLVPFVQLGPVDYIQDGQMNINALAAYAQATLAVARGLRLTAAGRYSNEQRDTAGSFSFGTVTPIDYDNTWRKFTPKFGVEYDVNARSMVYASVTNGFKSGTYNVGQVNPPIQPETIWAYEAGFKARLLDNTLQLNGAYFHYDYTNLQVNKIIGIATVTTNAASAKTDGFELAATWKPVRAFQLDGNFNYLDARFSNFYSANPLYPGGPGDAGYPIWQAANPGAPTPVFGGVGGIEQNLTGYALPGSPKYSFDAGAEYKYDIQGGKSVVTARVDLAYSSRIQYSEFNDDNLSQGPVAKLNAFLAYDSGSFWTLKVWGKNLTNRFIKSNETVTIALWGYPRYGAVEPPRTFGGTFGAKF